MPKIGIGVITTLSRELHPNLLNLLGSEATLHVYVDHERRGPAWGRNECVRTLYEAGCEYIVLLDDDTYPKRKGWEHYLIGSMLAAGVDVLSYPDPTVAVKIAAENGMGWWRFNTGCFTMISRKTVEKIGYFNTAYRTYGYEDISYLHRARMAGLTGSADGDAAPQRLAEFIHSEDIYGSDRSFNPFANMTREEKEASIASNSTTFHDEVDSGRIYVPYAQ